MGAGAAGSLAATSAAEPGVAGVVSRRLQIKAVLADATTNSGTVIHHHGLRRARATRSLVAVP
jgi:hypothetical protein